MSESAPNGAASPSAAPAANTHEPKGGSPRPRRRIAGLGLGILGLGCGLLIGLFVSSSGAWGVVLIALAALGLGRLSAPQGQSREVAKLRRHIQVLEDQLRLAPPPSSAALAKGGRSGSGKSSRADTEQDRDREMSPPVSTQGESGLWAQRIDLQRDLAHWRHVWALLADPGLHRPWLPLDAEAATALDSLRQQRQQIRARGEAMLLIRPAALSAPASPSGSAPSAAAGPAGSSQGSSPDRVARDEMTAAQHALANVFLLAFDSTSDQWLDEVRPDTLAAAEERLWAIAGTIDRAASLAGLELNRNYVSLRLAEGRLRAQSEDLSRSPVPPLQLPTPATGLLAEGERGAVAQLTTSGVSHLAALPGDWETLVVLQSPLLADEVYWVGRLSHTKIAPGQDEVWIAGWPAPWVVLHQQPLTTGLDTTHAERIMTELRPWALLDRAPSDLGMWIRAPWRELAEPARAVGWSWPSVRPHVAAPATRTLMARLGQRVLEAGARTPGLEALTVWHQEILRALGPSPWRAPRPLQLRTRHGDVPAEGPAPTAEAPSGALTEGGPVSAFSAGSPGSPSSPSAPTSAAPPEPPEASLQAPLSTSPPVVEPSPPSPSSSSLSLSSPSPSSSPSDENIRLCSN